MSMMVEVEEDESIFTKDERSVRYERIQEITQPDRPKDGLMELEFSHGLKFHES